MLFTKFVPTFSSNDEYDNSATNCKSVQLNGKKKKNTILLKHIHKYIHMHIQISK